MDKRQAGGLEILIPEGLSEVIRKLIDNSIEALTKMETVQERSKVDIETGIALPNAPGNGECVMIYLFGAKVVAFSAMTTYEREGILMGHYEGAAIMKIHSSQEDMTPHIIYDQSMDDLDD